MWSYVAVTSSSALDVEKMNRLIDEFPRALKAHFVRDTPKTVHAFTKRLKGVAVEHAYEQSADSGQINLAASAAQGNAWTVKSSALALQQLLRSPTGTATTPVYATLTGHAVAINNQISDFAKAANKETRISKSK